MGLGCDEGERPVPRPPAHHFHLVSLENHQSGVGASPSSLMALLTVRLLSCMCLAGMHLNKTCWTFWTKNMSRCAPNALSWTVSTGRWYRVARAELCALCAGRGWTFQLQCLCALWHNSRRAGLSLNNKPSQFRPGWAHRERAVWR